LKPPPDFFLGVILTGGVCCLSRGGKPRGLGVGFPTALFSGGVEEKKIILQGKKSKIW
jgi:hypothetical protein